MLISRKLRKALTALTLPLNRERFDRLLAHLQRVAARKFVVFIGHADYLVSGGGTEKYQYNDLSVLNGVGYDVVQIYPVPYNKLRLYGINWNDRPLARGITSGQLRELVTALRNSGKFFSFNIHHLLGWDNAFIRWFVGEVAGTRVLVYLHDFFAICPSKHLFRHDRHYCGYLENPDVTSVCRGCRYQVCLKEWRDLFSTVFDVATGVICPSVVVADVIRHTYRIDEQKINVCGHLRGVVGDRCPSRTTAGRPRIAFLGAAKDYKGWEIFRRIYRDPELRRHYDFYHIGSTVNLKTPRLHRVAYSFHDNRYAAVEALSHHGIDLVLLLSLVPESYSFTLHESFAACVPVIALEQSGNIAWTIHKGEIFGRVFFDGDHLMAFLKNPHAVSEFVAGSPYRHLSTLEHESAFVRLFGRNDCAGEL